MIAECLVVEFRVTDDDCPVATAARETGASVDANPPLLRSDGHALLHLTASDPAVGERLDADDRIRYLHGVGADGRHSYRCLSEAPCAVHRLVDAGFLVDSVHHRAGTERYVGAVVGNDVLGGVLAAAGGTVGVSVERISRLGDDGDDAVARRWDLTPPQEEAVETAYQMGYFSVPREVTASEVAEAIGVSKSAFLERLRRAQSSFFGHLYDPGGE
ncbi:helix-turn-helix domain-containing protein [Salinirubellus sp. GCM10025818]|uniref:helix-turn-helix domain-containing protein n=1 Tax=Salinirubellus TaxID=2162630 RepID=UPI0030CB9887